MCDCIVRSQYVVVVVVGVVTTMSSCYFDIEMISRFLNFRGNINCIAFMSRCKPN